MKIRTSQNIATPLLIIFLSLWASFATIHIVLEKPAATVQPKQPALSAVIQQPTINYVNKIRADHGLRPVTEDSRLDASAKLKADDMVAKQYFGHDDPAGKPWFRFLYAAVPTLHHTGENLGHCYRTEEGVYSAYVNSPTHLANLLDPGFTIYGSATEWDNTQSCLIWVDHFGGY